MSGVISCPDIKESRTLNIYSDILSNFLRVFYIQSLCFILTFDRPVSVDFKKQDVQLCHKVKKGQWKCHINCVGRIAQEVRRKKACVGGRKIHSDGSFQPQQSVAESSKRSRQVTPSEPERVEVGLVAPRVVRLPCISLL